MVVTPIHQARLTPLPPSPVAAYLPQAAPAGTAGRGSQSNRGTGDTPKASGQGRRGEVTPDDASPTLIPHRAGMEETKMGMVLAAVREVVDEAVAYANEPGALEPPAPDQLATKEDAIAAIRTGVWWAGRKGRRPTVPLGTTHVQNSYVDTAPIAALAPLLISPGATKGALETTHDYVMVEGFGKSKPRTDSVKFWTSPRMQKKHGYTIEGVEENRYVYRHRRP